MVADDTTRLQYWIDRLAAGDDAARRELVNHSYERLRRLAATILGQDFPDVKARAGQETLDIVNEVGLRLYEALDEVRPPTVQDFFRLAAARIRWILLDLARKRRAEGEFRQHETPSDFSGNERTPSDDPADTTHDPRRLAIWTELHEQIDKLPVEEQQVMDLLWYQGLTQSEAAVLLGVSVRTIKYRWQSARLRLYDALRGELPTL